VLAALDMLGQPLAHERVHRLERVLAATSRVEGDLAGEREVVATLLDPSGYPSRLRAGLRSAVFLNKTESVRGVGRGRAHRGRAQAPLRGRGGGLGAERNGAAARVTAGRDRAGRWRRPPHGPAKLRSVR
jgi:hypothetical protein